VAGFGERSRRTEPPASCTAYDRKAPHSSGVRRRLASEILREARILHRKIADLDERIGAEVEASLAEQPHRDLRRGTDKWPPRSSQQSVTWRVSRAQGSLRFLYSGTAPIEASSSGEVLRHRLSPLAGNRRLNNALHMIALCQARSDLQGGGVYYRKKLAEGKSCKGALCGASRGASLMPSLRASWLIWGRAFMQCCLTKRSLEVDLSVVRLSPEPIRPSARPTETATQAPQKAQRSTICLATSSRL
jgi:hypothetical protein